ncbi:SPASM domain-containing protein, partial [Candidatus Bathyarchaeota archaeon]|nr:SPASM domain-containing protein [Candidatus Bathyarchaeota archaeon]
TNGTLLDDEWCQFFKENNFLVGISIDGPDWLHDTYRVDKKGKSTFNKVMRGLRLLQKHNVEYNILVTVNQKNADYPLEVYRFLRDKAVTSWIQFIPVVTRIDSDGRSLYQKGIKVSNHSVRPIQFGRFLILIFDEWIRNDVGQVFVQTLEATARNWLCLPSSGMCVFEKTCGLGLALEHNGDLYSCDHFVEPNFLLGNIMQTHMRELAASEPQRKFGQDKFNALPRVCRECNMLFACKGECPKNRFVTTLDGEPGLNYLCAGWKAFFKRASSPIQSLTALMRTGRPASDIMQILAEKEVDWQVSLARARPKDPCPCRSGLKFDQCHGWKVPDHAQKRGKG